MHKIPMQKKVTEKIEDLKQMVIQSLFVSSDVIFIGSFTKTSKV